MNRYSIGVDIGGTNTDAVLITDENQIIQNLKLPTTSPMEIGVVQCVEQLLEKNNTPPQEVKRVSISTTHALNALLQGNALRKTGLIRIASNRPAIPGGIGIPKALRDKFLVGTALVDGGFECDGSSLAQLQAHQVVHQAQTLQKLGAECIALCSTFGSCFPQHEDTAAQYIQKELPTLFISRSHEVGGLGFLERENATLLNCALSSIVQQGFSAIADTLVAKGIARHAIVFVQNDGSEIGLEDALHLPVSTLASGPTNSGRGGSLLGGCENCIVIDVGGTSTDIIQVVDGHVKRSEGVVEIANISLNFSCPDIYSIALGGGSIVNPQTNEIGPKSVGYRLLSEAQSFGGHVPTLFDLGIKTGVISHPQADAEAISISTAQAEELLLQAAQKIAHGISLVRGEKRDLPYVLVGGGAPILTPFVERLVQGNNTKGNGMLSVANAFGASQAEISGVAKEIGSLDNRQQLLNKLSEEATRRAVLKGADPLQARVVSISITPFAYSKGNLGTVAVRVLGKKQEKSSTSAQ